MIQIKQDELKKALLHYYTNELKDTLYHIFLFEQKYAMDFEAFRAHEESLDKEDFEKGDDLMEWKADRSYVKTLWRKINSLENGDFEII